MQSRMSGRVSTLHENSSRRRHSSRNLSRTMFAETAKIRPKLCVGTRPMRRSCCQLDVRSSSMNSSRTAFAFAAKIRHVDGNNSQFVQNSSRMMSADTARIRHVLRNSENLSHVLCRREGVRWRKVSSQFVKEFVPDGVRV